VTIDARESIRADVSRADAVCTVTSSLKPIIFGESITNGARINAEYIYRRAAEKEIGPEV
jgi:ornithine cyclodeaminase/alanine dehydrogenase-like protein (mu-crystallin family)